LKKKPEIKIYRPIFPGSLIEGQNQETLSSSERFIAAASHIFAELKQTGYRAALSNSGYTLSTQKLK
jgi:hypothetical protein